MNSLRFLNVNMCVVNCTLDRREATPIFETSDHIQQIFIVWPSNLVPNHNISSNNKLVQDQVHKRLAHCKHFATLKVINSMGELVNKHTTPIFIGITHM